MNPRTLIISALLVAPAAGCGAERLAGPEPAFESDIQIDVEPEPDSVRTIPSLHVDVPAVVAPIDAKTTSGLIAVNNLSAQLAGYEHLLASQPADPLVTAQVVGILLTRSQFIGSTSDLTHAEELAETAVDAHPDSADALLLRARVASAVHRFRDALDDLDLAEEAGASPAQLATQRASVRLALGDPHDALTVAETQVADGATFASLSQLASVYMELGRYAEADEMFVAAAAAYADVSPFPIAWVDFQRGVMWAERANMPELAYDLYEAALVRVPPYAVAAVHFAELLADAGDLPAAVSLLQPVAAEAEDPEPSALLSHLLRLTGDAEASDAHLTSARERYELLLTELPEAYADHAAEFWLKYDDDLDKALSLALQNLALRPTSRAYQLAVTCAAAAEDLATTCQLLDEALELVYPTPALIATLQDTLSLCSE